MLERAREQYGIATETNPRNTAYHSRCSAACKAVEVAIKAVIVANASGYRDTHDIETLLNRVEEIGETVPEKLRAAQALMAYDDKAWYGDSNGRADPVTPEDHATAVALAARVVAWATERIEARVPEPTERSRPANEPRGHVQREMPTSPNSRSRKGE